MNLLDKKKYKLDAIKLAKELLGKLILIKGENEILVKIVETEAYMGSEDKASHSYNNKRTKRTEAMFLDGGYIYVYLIYGMYNCLNIVCNEVDNPQAVLIRAVEPIKGIDYISMNRFEKYYNELTSYQKKNLTNGPGKLCKSLNIDKSYNKKKVNECDIYIIDNKEKVKIAESKRVNIDYAKEAKEYLWRFYIKDNKFVSK